MNILNSFNSKTKVKLNNKEYTLFSLQKAQEQIGDISNLPKSLKVLLENLLRFEDGISINASDIRSLANWKINKKSDQEIQYSPTRVLMQDFTGVPAVVDLASMRDTIKKVGQNPEKINPISNVDLVIDHSVMVDHYATNIAFQQNVDMEIKRNEERYRFLRWGQKAFKNFRVVPPGTGICHQVNLEYLAKTVWQKKINNDIYIFPDSLVGTDSHTTMINALGVLGWGVGGIEAEAAMLGQPISMLIPEVIGFKLTGKLREGITATDLVLTIAQILRQKGVVGKFVEFYGEGLDNLSISDRATIANMAPEYGATCGFFPVDNITLNYLRLTNRSEELIELVEYYCKLQGLWRNSKDEPIFTDIIHLDINEVETSLAGPKRPQDKVLLKNVPLEFNNFIKNQQIPDKKNQVEYKIDDKNYILKQGSIVIAAITSCTNTSNPNVMIGAGLLAKKAVEKGLIRKPWVKTSLAPGSKVVTEYLNKTKLNKYLDHLGFNLVGFGCTTCIGNSGPLDKQIEDAIQSSNLTVASILSGNRNFEGRIHPLVKTNWLASPALVVAYAIAGNININLATEPLSKDKKGNDVYLKDIWPTQKEILKEISQVSQAMFAQEYSNVFVGDDKWQSIKFEDQKTYNWQDDSTYIRNPDFFKNIQQKEFKLKNIINARIIALLGDSVTTDHISPAGNIKFNSPAGKYLKEHGVKVMDFNSYGSRRGNHEVMTRGTFANIRIKNEMLTNVEGGFTIHIPSNEQMAIYDASVLYKKENIPLVVIAGKEYGTGSSRDWAAKGTNLLGIKVVIAESFERIHRSNLIGMGVLPLQFINNINRKTLLLTGKETISILGINKDLKPKDILEMEITRENNKVEKIKVLCRIDTNNELSYFESGGILHYVLNNLIAQN